MTTIQIVVQMTAEGAALTALCHARESVRPYLSQTGLEDYNVEVEKRRTRIIGLAEIVPSDPSPSEPDLQLLETARSWIGSVKRFQALDRAAEAEWQLDREHSANLHC